MSLKNTKTHYGSVAKFFHWLISPTVIILLIAGFFMDDIANKSLKGQVYHLHKLVGLSILMLMVLRLFWVLNNPKPTLPSSLPAWQRFTAHTVQYAFYVLLIAMPLSGWVMSTASGYEPHLLGFSLAMPGISQSKALAHQAHTLHYYIGWGIVVALTLHVLAALKHHFINQDNVLRRMLP